ncbi:MAG: SDR family NAD(P)-dependent oxidoreductase [Acidimicrobiia bacterium]
MKVAIVTGGTRGLGRALAEGLGRDGWAVVIDGRDPAAVAVAERELGKVTTVRAVAGDVAEAAHRQALVDAAAGLGRLELLVNNASTLGPSPLPALADYPLDRLEQVYRVNVLAPLGLVQLALPLLRASAGAVLNVTSDAAVEGYEGWGGYGSSKAALEQLTNVLAAEDPTLAVWAFDPGDMRTVMHQEAFPGEDISDRPEPATVVPTLVRLVRDRPASGRYRAADLLDGVRP